MNKENNDIEKLIKIDTDIFRLIKNLKLSFKKPNENITYTISKNKKNESRRKTFVNSSDQDVFFKFI